jgi:hypothetical protein
VPNGYQAGLASSLAVRVAPAIIGKLTPDLLRAELACNVGIAKPEPAILDVGSFTGSTPSASIDNIFG